MRRGLNVEGFIGCAFERVNRQGRPSNGDTLCFAVGRATVGGRSTHVTFSAGVTCEYTGNDNDHQTTNAVTSVRDWNVSCKTVFNSKNARCAHTCDSPGSLSPHRCSYDTGIGVRFSGSLGESVRPMSHCPLTVSAGGRRPSESERRAETRRRKPGVFHGDVARCPALYY